jgi:hypothetical protein
MTCGRVYVGEEDTPVPDFVYVFSVTQLCCAQTVKIKRIFNSRTTG